MDTMELCFGEIKKLIDKVNAGEIELIYFCVENIIEDREFKDGILHDVLTDQQKMTITYRINAARPLYKRV